MIVRLRATASTMIDAAALAGSGEPHGTVVVAEEQTSGVGRHGHTWHSAPGAGLYLSIILRLPLTPEEKPVLTMALGLAVQRAVNDLADVACDLRWPNDVILNEKKLAGILVQATEGGAFIAGIGINVNQTAFPPSLAPIATSLRIETGREHSKHDLLDRVIAESLRYAAIPKSEVLKQFGRHSTYVSGKAVQIDNRFQGITSGLDENGFLLVSTADGMQTVISGGVRPV